MTIDALSELEDFGDGEKPWCNLVFEITEIGNANERGLPTNNSFIVFRTLAAVPAGEIGFEARVPVNGWTSQDTGQGIVVHWGHISLCSIGEPTDRLLQHYESWFGLPSSGAAAPPEVRCLAVLLGDSPAEIEKSKIHSKLFFDGSEGQSLESYAELFLNFDLPVRRAWLCEKDPDYRTPLVAWLAGHYRQATEPLH